MIHDDSLQITILKFVPIKFSFSQNVFCHQMNQNIDAFRPNALIKNLALFSFIYLFVKKQE